ncbi:MAG TPA: glycosyltransferase family A protein [Solirubrobacteraceae bacterium]|nr:glycosyltransferase family A protein [Solirubrobacteraceae bacterium]
MQDHAITDLRATPGELFFTARIGDREHGVWFRTDAPVTPNADAALAACLPLAMRFGGRLAFADPLSPRLLQRHREYQGVQRAWSRVWEFDVSELQEVEVAAPRRDPGAETAGRGVGAFFSGGVDSWSTLLDNPDITHVIFGRGLDLPLDSPLTDEVESALRSAADELGIALITVETNLRELSDPLFPWVTYFVNGLMAMGLLLAPLFERVIIPVDLDHEMQMEFGSNLRIARLFSTEHLELFEDGGRFSREQKLARIARHPVVQRSLRVCWENRGGAYNCGVCRKCLMTLISLEALGVRERFETFPSDADLTLATQAAIKQISVLDLWQDVLDTTHAAAREDLEQLVGQIVEEGKRACGFGPAYRRRLPEPASPAPQPLDQRINEVRTAAGELSFTASVAGTRQRIWFRTDADVTPTADAALASCLMPAMRAGGQLTVDAPISPRLLRGQREYQSLQRSWSRGWEFGDSILEEVEVQAPVREPAARTGRGVAAFFSGGVDSWATVLANPDITHVVFVRGLDIRHDDRALGDRVEAQLRCAAGELGLPLIVVETNLRDLSDRLAVWDMFCGCAIAAVALFLAPLFERVLVATDADHELQVRRGVSMRATELLSTEHMQIEEASGGRSRFARTAMIARDPVVQRSLRVCWRNPGGAYNCGRCRKCLMTMATLELLGARAAVKTFPPELDLAAIGEIELADPLLLGFWQDILDGARAEEHAELERPVGRVVARARRLIGLEPDYRRRSTPAPPAPVRIAVVVPAYKQPQFLAGAVRSALEQQVDVGVGVVIVDDGCPYDSTRAIAQELVEADPAHVAYLRQENRGLSAARNAGIAHALARWPLVEAVFPLDADNLLSPGTLAALWEVLEERPDVDWVSPRLELMGAEEGTWFVPGPYLAYRQLFDNQSDAGSLIRRRVFDAGLRYDETMRDGYEDWEFALAATLAGFRGAKAGEVGFRYRRRPASMVAGAQERADAIRAHVRARHAEAFAPRALVTREHDEAPRFALVRCDRADVLLTAACDREPHVMSWNDFASRVDATGGGWWPSEEPVPPITVLATAPLLDWLSERGLLAGMVFRMQVELRGHEFAALRIGHIVAIAARTRTLHLRGAENLMVGNQLDFGLDDAPAFESPEEGLAGLGSGRHGGLPGLPVPTHAHRGEELHIEELETTLPWHGEGRVITLVMPGLWNRSAPAILRAARQLDPSLRLHLVLTEDDDLEELPRGLFDVVVPLGGRDGLEAALRGSDAVLHTAPPVQCGDGRHVLLCDGGPGDAVAARFLDGSITAYLAPTEEIAARLVNFEAVPDKITLAPPAAVLRPDDPEHSRRLAADKNRAEGPPRVLCSDEAPIDAETLTRTDVFVVAEGADPTLALDAMAYGCLVITEEELVAGPVPDAPARRDRGVELALASSWQPAAQALLDAIGHAPARVVAA